FRSDRSILDADILVQLASYLINDDLAQVKRVADRFLVGTDECKGRRILAIAQLDDATVADLLQRAGIGHLEGGRLRLRLRRQASKERHGDDRRGGERRARVEDSTLTGRPGESLQ